jgi:hypothetical protein
VYRTRTAHASNAGRLAAPLARGAQHRRDCHGGTPAPPRGTQNPLWCQPRDGRGTGRDRGREMAHTMVTHRETASRWAAEPLCQSHIITRISRNATRARDRRRAPCTARAMHFSRATVPITSSGTVHCEAISSALGNPYHVLGSSLPVEHSGFIEPHVLLSVVHLRAGTWLLCTWCPGCAATWSNLGPRRSF